MTPKMRLATSGMVFGLAVSACTGAIDGADESGGGPGGSSGPGGSASADSPAGTGDGTRAAQPGASSPGTATSAACTVSGILPAPLRRLSHPEYTASLRDLFPGLALGTPTLVKDPADHGFENRADLTNPSALLIEQYSTAAADVAARAIAKPQALLPCTPTAATEAACGAQFVDSFGQRIFRRPLTADEKKTYTDFLNAERAAGDGFNGAVQLTIEAMLQAPQFLYRLEFGQPDPAMPGQARLSSYEIASRMSYLLWGSEPDAALLNKAQASQLDAPADREKEARRMLADARAQAMFVDFHRQWLDLDRLDQEPKDAKTYPTYTAELKTAIRDESNRFVAGVMAGDGTVRSLLTSAKTEVNAPLAKFYGVTAPATGWAEAMLPATERAGFLTRANFLAARAHMVAGSPPLRAVFVLDRFLCQAPPPPPDNADLTEPAAKATTTKQTNRQLFEARLAPPACGGCHGAFTGLGYALENYDGIGHYRTQDNGLPVDATGAFGDWKFSGGVDLSSKLADSPQVQACVAGYWFEYALGRDRQPSDDCRVRKLADTLTTARGDVREMLVALIKNTDFAYRPLVKP